MREWLKKLRTEKCLTQGETAKLLLISQQYYSAIEKGQRQIDLSLLMANRIRNLFKVSFEHIISEELKNEQICFGEGESGSKFVPEDSDRIYNQNEESVSNMFLM